MKNLLPAACRLALIFGAMPALAGTFSTTTLFGDADSGIDSSLIYTHKIDFGNVGAPRTVNGVTFDSTALWGDYYRTSNLGAFLVNGNNLVTGDTGQMIRDFRYTGDNSGDSFLRLDGLVVGQTYTTTWYNRGFGTPDSRVINIIPSDTGTPFTFDQNYSGDQVGHTLTYTFTATSSFISYTFDGATGNSFHQYALTNSGPAIAMPAAVVPTITAVSGVGPFTPFIPRNDDLLQAHLSGVNSSGNFQIADLGSSLPGGIPALTDGSFTIIGGNPSDNSSFATGASDAFIEFILNTAENPFGYDVSSIETYGGWNDSGRNAQRFVLYYSKVGSPDFELVGSINYDTTPPNGETSAIRAIFDTDLTNVDAIRIDFPRDQDNNWAGYGEIDVVGAVSVPEPASATLLLGATGSLLARRRRRS